MNQEVKLFRELLYLRNGFFESNGYIFSEERIYNEQTDMEFFHVKLDNKNLEKEITFSFHQSIRRMGANEIMVGITKKSGEGGIDIHTFLAYRELKRRISYKDTKKYFFKVDPQNLEKTINQQLGRIIAILSTDMKELFTTEKWINIPQEDPRRGYY